MVPQGVERKLTAILSADVVGYSRLMAEDESATVRTATAYREQIEMLVRQHQGRVVDFVGDNLMGEFPTATAAVNCAVEIQGVLKVLNAGLPGDRKMEFRIGIHLGEVRIEGERLYGDGVNIAARLEGLAEAGGLCVSRAVHEQVRRQSTLTFVDLGAQQLRNIPDPVHVYRVRWSDATPAHAALGGARSEPSVAVLPFANMSPDPDQEYFADGMAEELINALTKVEGLRVIARTSAFSFKGTKADISAIGAKLNVSAVVEGSVRKAGNRLRIAAQLIAVDGSHHLWSEVYDRSLDDVFQVQDEISRHIVMTIKPKLLANSPAPLVTRPTDSQEAYELYLRAVDRISRHDRWDTRTAIEMLKDATTIDPEYADAWARLALACIQMDFSFEPGLHWHEQAERAVHRAFELAPTNAEAHLAHGRILWSPRKGFQNRPALRALGKALQLQPGSHQARVWFSVVLLHVGLMDEAREWLAAALSAEPDNPFTLNIITQVAWFQGRYREAEACMARAMAADPTLLYNHLFHPVIWIYQNDLRRAEEALRKARQLLGDDPLIDSNEALLWAKRGEPGKTEEALSRALQDKPSLGHIHHTWHYAAATHAILGRSSEAIQKIRAAIAAGLPNYPLFRDDPHLASLREEPEMRDLMSELEREDAEFRREFGRYES